MNNLLDARELLKVADYNQMPTPELERHKESLEKVLKAVEPLHRELTQIRIILATRKLEGLEPLLPPNTDLLEPEYVTWPTGEEKP